MISAMSSPHNRTGRARIMAIAEALRLLPNGFYGVSANHIGRLFPLIMAANQSWLRDVSCSQEHAAGSSGTSPRVRRPPALW
jgi:hypothetical protein